MQKNDNKLDEEKRKQDWKEVESLVIRYQLQYKNNTEDKLDVKEESDKAGLELLKRFTPLFIKYLAIIKHGVIDYSDNETKYFISSFLDSSVYKKINSNKKMSASNKALICSKFAFIRDTYGAQSEDEILNDLQYAFLILAKRYKNVGKSFCAYVARTYRFEVSRNIKNYTKEPTNIAYKNLPYEDYANSSNDKPLSIEDNYYESSTGIPDMFWINGQTCSNIFTCLSTIDRQILVKYYLEDWNDKDIAESFGMHINTINQRRRNAVSKLAEELNINPEDIKRQRRSGKNKIALS